MKFSERVKIAWDTFRRLGGYEFPDKGRASDETLTGALGTMMSRYSTINPIISFEMLGALKNFWIYNPDFSQYVDNMTNLANTGHTLTVAAGTDAAAEAALNRMNETAARLYKNAAGVDGLINAYIAQIAVFGALSSEDVVNFAGRRVEQTVLVPVETIRFKYDPDAMDYLPFQRTNGLTRSTIAAGDLGLIPLAGETYRYFALQTIENSPYGKPPASAVIEAICEMQKPIMENIRYIAQKIGIMGLVSAAVTAPPKKSGETDAEYQARAAAYLKSVNESLQANFHKGLLTHYKDQKLEHTDVTSGAAGVYDVNRMSEEQIMSGFGMQPSFFGRTDSTTETFADVVYSVLEAKVGNVQRLPKRRMERTYTLDLRLAGTEVDGISLKFNKTYSRSLLEQAQTEQLRVTTTLQKIRAGAISPDEGAQELGYDHWFDEALLEENPALSATLRRLSAREDSKIIKMHFDKDAQRYVNKRPVITLQTNQDEGADEDSHVVPFVKKKAHQA